VTPYDTALRVQRREVDALRLSISVEVARLTTIETQQIAFEQSVQRERAAAVALPVPSDAWARRMRAERARMKESASLAAARLATLRRQAGEAYGTARAIEIAAGDYHDQQQRDLALSEQAAADDLAAAAFLRARRIRSRTA